MEEKPNIEISETNRGKEQLIINKKYKYNFSNQKKDNSKVYRCTEYKTLNKCKSFIILDANREIIKYESLHNHLEQEVDVSISIVKHKIKDEIRKSSQPFDIKPKRLFNEISQEMGFICPKYETIKSQITRNLNKHQPRDIKRIKEIPDESEFYKTERGEEFMIFKNNDILIFQSSFQADLFSKYNEDMFTDSTLYKTTSIDYQVFITRAYISELNNFYVTSVSILQNKNKATYKVIFEEIQKNVTKVNNNTKVTPINFHCDFDSELSSAAKEVFPEVNIKYSIWHYKRSLEIQKNKSCYKEVEENSDIYNYYKAISNLPFINPEYVNDIYNKINNSCESHSYVQFLKFLDFFKKNYLLNFNVSYWNHYDNIEQLIDNITVSFNNFTSTLFTKKPTYFKLLNKLKKEESSTYNVYNKKIGSLSEKKRKITGKVNEINKIITRYKVMESNCIKNGSNRNVIIDLWFKCLIELSNKNTNI